MCGIAGFVEFKRDSLTKGNPYGLLNSMLNTIDHRGPDDFGMSFFGYKGLDNIPSSEGITKYSDLILNAALGHKRLSIIDLSVQGRQPMKDNSGNLEIIFNGEIYNYIELKEGLGGRYSFRTNTDTEVLLALYSFYGVDMFSMLDGMYSFAILDNHKKKLLCARDAMGIKPFYYSLSSEYFVFGSEPKTVLAGLQSSGTIDMSRVSEFLLTAVSDHDDGTSYNEVKQLKSGYFLELSLDGSNSDFQKYWSFEYHPVEANDIPSQLHDRLMNSVMRQFRADVSVGTSLSGGIDSGTIVTLAGDILGKDSENYNTFTFSFHGFENDESEYARLIAGNAGMNWHPVIPDMNTLRIDLEKMMYGIGEPFTTLSMFAQYKVMESANNKGIKVMLDGQGGDEVYLGYPRLAQRVMKEYLLKGKLSGFFREWLGFKKNASVSYIRSFLGNFFFTSPSTLLNVNKKRLRNYVSLDLLNSYRKDFLDDLSLSGNIIDDQINELKKFILPKLLKYADRNSMAFSVESRVPHLSVPLAEYALNLPLNWKVRDGWTKYSVRKAMNGKMPNEVLWSKKKLGFDIPQKYWVETLRDDLKKWLTETDLSRLINVDKIIQAIDFGHADKSYLWRVISIGCWIKFMGVKI